MKKFLYVMILLIAVIIFFSVSSGETDSDYRSKVAEVRKERIGYLKTSKDSPFQQFDKKFHPPSYFPIDPDYKVQARLERIQSIQRIPIQSSDGSTQFYNKFAYANFTLNGQTLKLLILKPSGFGVPNTYFTAFADETSTITSYGGGRYLDLEIGKSDKVEIDFNLAYNPYCAYTAEYSCPLPPAENILTIAIAAGEKDYNH